jgi:hypothetical protein
MTGKLMLWTMLTLVVIAVMHALIRSREYYIVEKK